MNQRGFSLIELLLSVVIISLLAGMSMPLYQSLQTRNDLDNTTQSIADALRRAQSYARSGKSDSIWSVKVEPDTVWLYKGLDFLTRTQGFDEPVYLSDSFTIAGLSTISFSKLTGAPSTTGTITLTATANEVRTITVNAEGMVSY